MKIILLLVLLTGCTTNCRPGVEIKSFDNGFMNNEFTINEKCYY